jgi:Glycosyl transferases group 1
VDSARRRRASSNCARGHIKLTMPFRRTQTWARKARALRARLGIIPTAKVLLFVGRLGREKNVEFLIRAFAALRPLRPDVRLVIVGDGPIRNHLESLATRLTITNEATLTGSVAHAEIALYYQAADVFLFSSLTDTQGIVVLEAIASGLPVIALRDEAFTLMVKDGRNGLLLSRNTLATHDSPRRLPDCSRIGRGGDGSQPPPPEWPDNSPKHSKLDDSRASTSNWSLGARGGHPSRGLVQVAVSDIVIFFLKLIRRLDAVLDDNHVHNLHSVLVGNLEKVLQSIDELAFLDAGLTIG